MSDVQIWKWELEIDSLQQINTPADWEPIFVDVQGGTPCVWAKVQPDNPTVSRLISVIGTGHGIPDIAKTRYLGSFQLQLNPSGVFVGHVFERY